MLASNRLAGFSGLLLVSTLFLFQIIIPSVIAGNGPTGTFDQKEIFAYYNHPDLIWTFWAGGITLIFAVLFFLGIYGSLHPRATDSGLAVLLMAAVGMGVAEVAVLTVQVSIQGALVGLSGLHSATTDPTQSAALEAVTVGLFRFWDVLYNSFAYWFEAGWSLLFSFVFFRTKAAGIALLGLGAVVSAYQVFNSAAIYLGVPDMATLPGNLFLALWFVAASVSLLRLKPVSS